ncbi:MAG: transcription antitermination factor NusB [Chlamydiales bacterium]|nr:transcription antitermination factor NusB [Chlamydiales bacterium]
MMQLPIQKHREIIFLVLYSHHISSDLSDDPTLLIMHELKTTKKNVHLAIDIARKIETHLIEIDALISGISEEYAFDRISAIEKNIIRLAIYELIHEQLDIKIAVAEAIRLCKKFSTVESSKFVNAIIDQVYHGYSNKALSNPQECFT